MESSFTKMVVFTNIRCGCKVRNKEVNDKLINSSRDIGKLIKEKKKSRQK